MTFSDIIFKDNQIIRVCVCNVDKNIYEEYLINQINLVLVKVTLGSHLKYEML